MQLKHLLLCALAVAYATPTVANDEPAIRLSVSPITCVALHKRQVCHKTLNFTWTSLPAGQYCLHSSETLEPVKCWQDNKLNRLAVTYRSATKIQYELREASSETPIAHAVVKTAWVYRTSRRSSSGWRLF